MCLIIIRELYRMCAMIWELQIFFKINGSFLWNSRKLVDCENKPVYGIIKNS